MKKPLRDPTKNITEKSHRKVTKHDAKRPPNGDQNPPKIYEKSWSDPVGCPPAPSGLEK